MILAFKLKVAMGGCSQQQRCTALIKGLRSTRHRSDFWVGRNSLFSWKVPEKKPRSWKEMEGKKWGCNSEGCVSVDAAKHGLGHAIREAQPWKLVRISWAQLTHRTGEEQKRERQLQCLCSSALSCGKVGAFKSWLSYKNEASLPNWWGTRFVG